MSFILEALKKSENERQRKVGPSLADVQYRPRPSEKPWWAIAVGALLIVNLGVLVVVLTRDGAATTATHDAQVQQPMASQPQAPSRNSMPIAATPPPARVVQPAAAPTDPSVRSLADEATFDATAQSPTAEYPHLAAAGNVPSGPPIVRPIDAPAVAPAANTATFESRAAPINEVLPTVGEMAASGTSLPELHLDIHVHSANPAERFVFVNMRKYTEGQALAEGPTIERITADGVVLNHRGMRMLLPRQ